jgi:hypothetical protein
MTEILKEYGKPIGAKETAQERVDEKRRTQLVIPIQLESPKAY